VHRVITLLHQHRDDPASADLFEGIWKGTVICWDDLYYPPDRHQASSIESAAAPAVASTIIIIITRAPELTNL
jgi:hypothetical protein